MLQQVKVYKATQAKQLQATAAKAGFGSVSGKQVTSRGLKGQSPDPLCCNLSVNVKTYRCEVTAEKHAHARASCCTMQMALCFLSVRLLQHSGSA